MNPPRLVKSLRLGLRVSRVGLDYGMGAVLAQAQAVAGMFTRHPNRFLIAPQDIRTADPTRAADFHAGYFVFAGRAVECGTQSPFAVEPPSREWENALLGFSWLRHLRAAKTESARIDAQNLVHEFIRSPISRSPISRMPVAGNAQIAARRLISLLCQSPMLLEEADHGFYYQLLVYIHHLQRSLVRVLAQPMTDCDRLMVTVALAYYGLCVEVPPGVTKRSIARLRKELKRQMLPDGGHVSRNPAFMLELLLELLPLRQVFVARGQAAPPELMGAIDRMVPMLRMFRHGDGTLALFNGMGVTPPDNLAAVLAYDEGRDQPILNARYSGYQRMQGGNSVLIMDAGPPPLANASSLAHAGVLSFEFSDGDARIIINCGVPELGSRSLRAAARASAAHSTLILNDTSNAVFARHQGLERYLSGQVISGPHSTSVLREEKDDLVQIRATQDGYRRQFGLMHTRRMALTHDGNTLWGNDQLAFASKASKPLNLPFALRFHLHPDVQVMLANEGTAALLQLPNKHVWRFEAGGLPLALEESMLFAAPTGPRPTRQIVIHAIAEAEMQLSWSLSRVEVRA